jgi:dolichol-phosphate mannosyltransferase
VAPVVIIPTYNERANIVGLTELIKANLETDIIIVDDNSPDGTGEVIESLLKGNPRLHVIHRTQKMGLASAYKEGMQLALDRGFDPIIQMDCDYSHDPRYLQKLTTRASAVEMVIGSKYARGGEVIGLSWWRKTLSRYGNLYVFNLLRLKEASYTIRDSTSGYVIWRRALLQRIDLSVVRSHGYGFLVEMKWQAVLRGGTYCEEPITFKDRVNGRSKLTVGIFWEVLLLPWMLLSWSRERYLKSGHFVSKTCDC